MENSGGAIRNLNVVRSQRKLGLDPYVVTPLGYPEGAESTCQDGTAAAGGVEHIRIGEHWRKVDSLRIDQRLTLDVHETAAVIRERGASIIHAASGFRGYELALKAIALGRHFGVPVVYEVRSLHEHLWGSPRLANKLDREWTRLRMAQEDRCMNQATAIVTIAEAMRDVLVRRGVPAEKITVVPNAIDAEAFGTPPPRNDDLRRSLGVRHRVVGYISNMSYREGHDVLLHAVAMLAADGPAVQCLLVGDGPERSALEALARDLGIRDSVIFTGEVDHATIQQYYGLIDVFVVPRRADYAADFVTPLKPFEAMALGRGLVVSDRPALREIVGDGERGLIFRADSPRSLATEVKRLLDNEPLRRSLADKARHWVMTERTWEANARRYSDLYLALRTQKSLDVPRAR